MLLFLASLGGTSANLNSYITLVQGGVLGLFTLLWVTDKISNNSERDFLREENKKLKEIIVNQQRVTMEIQSHIIDGVTPLLAGVQSALTATLERLRSK